MDDRDEQQTTPPDAADVARRAAIIKLLFAHVASTPPPDLMAAISAKWSPTEQEQFADQLEERRRRLIDELRTSGLWEDTSPSERRIFEQPASALTMQDVVDTSWRAEAEHCLAWALGLVEEIPDYDTQTDPEVLIPLIPTVDIARVCATARLRDRDAIEAAREVAELWHWRSRTRRLQEQGYAPRAGKPSLDQIVRDLAPQLTAKGMLPRVIDEDFPVLGRAYRDLSDAEWTTARSIAMERHFALNWLCGYAPGNEWDETPTDT